MQEELNRLDELLIAGAISGGEYLARREKVRAQFGLSVAAG